MRFHRIVIIALCVSGCSSLEPVDLNYCKRQGLVVKTPEFARCMQDYEQKQARFMEDLIPCRDEAEGEFPKLMDDTAHRPAGIQVSRWGPYHDQELFEEPDYTRNYALNRQRDEITLRCMQAKGWKGIKSWEEGWK